MNESEKEISSLINIEDLVSQTSQSYSDLDSLLTEDTIYRGFKLKHFPNIQDIELIYNKFDKFSFENTEKILNQFNQLEENIHIKNYLAKHIKNNVQLEDTFNKKWYFISFLIIFTLHTFYFIYSFIIKSISFSEFILMYIVSLGITFIVILSLFYFITGAIIKLFLSFSDEYSQKLTDKFNHEHYIKSIKEQPIVEQYFIFKAQKEKFIKEKKIFESSLSNNNYYKLYYLFESTDINFNIELRDKLSLPTKITLENFENIFSQVKSILEKYPHLK